MYLSTQFEQVASSTAPVAQQAQAVMTINSPRENPFPQAKVNVIRLEQVSGQVVDDGWYMRQGAAGAERWWADYGWWVQERQWATHLCCHNEPEVKSAEQAQQANAYGLRWAQILTERYPQIKGILFNFSEGTPEPEMATHFLPVTEYMAKHGHLYGFHSYWWPRLNPDHARWNYRRWFYWYQELRKHTSNVPDCAITELGVDGGTVGLGGQGWRLAGISEDQYIADLKTFREETATLLPEVRFGFLFADGTYERFRTFEGSPRILQALLDTNPSLEDNMTPIYHDLPIDGRRMSYPQFDEYIRTMKWLTPRTSVWLHHTYRPTPETWAGAATMEAMRQYYMGLVWYDTQGRKHIGWDKGPHIFAAPDGIWLFYDIRKDGYHAGGVNNVGSIGWEMVGDYDAHLPTGGVLENTLQSIGSLFRHLKLDPDKDLRFHREVSPKSCPGWAVTKQWFLPLLKEHINPKPVVDYSWAYRWRLLTTPDHALHKHIASKGYIIVSPEFWNENSPDNIAYQWARDKNEFVLFAATPPHWTITEVYRMSA